MLVAGIDEAGRGSIIGPLTVAGVAVKEENLARLVELGVKDSKLLPSHKRRAFAVEIRNIAHEVCVRSLPPLEIDAYVKSGRKLHKLNRLEAQTMANVIEELRPDVVYVDAADVVEDRYKHHILELLRFKVKIVSEHKADRTYPVVSAASIIAKVERDKAIAELASKHGDIGCGYPTDTKTIAFLERWIQEVGEYPDFVRKSWRPARKFRSEKGTSQAKLI